MKFWNSAFDAQGSRLIIVVVHVRAVKKYICSSSTGGAQENGKTGWNSVYHQNWWFSEYHPMSNANVPFCKFLKNSHLVYDQTQGSAAVPVLLYK
jgi:hypothetical protein